MPAQPSTLLTLSFIALALALGAGFVAAVRAAGPADEPPHVRARWTLGAAAATLAWLALTGALAQAGLFAFGAMPPPLLALMGGVFIALTALTVGPVGRRLALGLPMAALVGFQAFRILVELLLHRAHVEGLIPIQMSYLGYNFDVLSGLTALILIPLIASGRAPRWLIGAWNALGLALLLTIVTISILSAPVPFRAFHEGPANVFVTFFPFVWLPTVLVAAALLGHMLVLRRLLHDRRAHAHRALTPSLAEPRA